MGSRPTRIKIRPSCLTHAPNSACLLDPLHPTTREAYTVGDTTNEGEKPMPTYITLLNWTQQGIQNVKDSPSRLEKAKAATKAAGGEIKAFYMTMGQYDMVVVIEAPDDETYAKTVLAIASHGAVKSQTLRAFTEAEYRKIVGSLP